MKHSQNGFIVQLAIALVALAAVGGGWYLYSQKAPTTKVTHDSAPVQDSDLRVAIGNTAVDCSVVNSLAATTTTELATYVTSTSSAKASVAVQKFIKKYASQIALYTKGGDWTKTATAIDANDHSCTLSAIKNSAIIALANAKYLAENKKSASAEKIITGVLATTQQMQDNAGTMIGYLVTLSVKESAINLLLSLKARGLINAAAYRAVLAQYTDNKTGQKKGLQIEYSRSVQRIDDIANDNYSSPLVVGDGSDSELISMIQKQKTSYTFEPNNTKALYYALYKSEYANVDLACGSTYTTVIPKFDLKDTMSENAIGKTIFSMSSVSMDGINNKRCAMEAKFGAF